MAAGRESRYSPLAKPRGDAEHAERRQPRHKAAANPAAKATLNPPSKRAAKAPEAPRRKPPQPHAERPPQPHAVGPPTPRREPAAKAPKLRHESPPRKPAAKAQHASPAPEPCTKAGTELATEHASARGRRPSSGKRLTRATSTISSRALGRPFHVKLAPHAVWLCSHPCTMTHWTVRPLLRPGPPFTARRASVHRHFGHHQLASSSTRSNRSLHSTTGDIAATCHLAFRHTEPQPRPRLGAAGEPAQMRGWPECRN